MKPSKYTFFTSLLCASGLSAGLCFCVMTSFAVPADGLSLVCACVLAALLFSALLLLPKSWIWLLAMAALAGGGFYMLRAQLVDSTSALVFAVTQQYSEAIPGIQTVHLTDTSGMDATLILILIAALYALLCSWTVMRSESLVYLLVLTLPVLALCLIILQTPPAAWAILLVVGVLALLLLTQLLRARQAGEGNRLALLLAAPLALLIGLLAVLFPAGTYDRAEWSDHLQETISTAADKLPLFRRDAKTGQVKFSSPISPSTLGSYLWDSSVTSVNLNRIGPQVQFGRSVMRVKSEVSGPVHLRGDSMAVYEDNRWKALPESDYTDTDSMMNALLAGIVPVSYRPDMQIETNMKSGIYYLPYFAAALPEDAVPYYDAYVKNPSQQTSYSIYYFSMRGSFVDNGAYETFVHEAYTQVPDETRQALADILPQLGVQPDDAPEQIVSAVQAYVSASASYDLSTPSVPNGEDFVSWFLHDSETGYCVHFATAAAILLRCLDVPARYVTGYSTAITANEWTTVTSDDAHAWVEYYFDGAGWYVLDPTPAADTPAQTAPEEPIAAPIEPADNQPEDTPPAGDEPPAVPDIPAESQETPQKTDKKSVNILHFVWPVLVLAAALFLWRALRFSVRRAAIGRGSPNRRAVALYHHICWLSRQTKTEVPSDFLEIAEKARFSHHKLNREDLLPMQAHAEQLTKQLLADKRFWKQVLYRVIYALG